jgi:hypothetical protein
METLGLCKSLSSSFNSINDFCKQIWLTNSEIPGNLQTVIKLYFAELLRYYIFPNLVNTCCTMLYRA